MLLLAVQLHYSPGRLIFLRWVLKELLASRIILLPNCQLARS